MHHEIPCWKWYWAGHWSILWTFSSWGTVNVHADNVTSSQARDLVSSMAALGISFVLALTNQASHMLDPMSRMGIDVDLIAKDAVL